MFTMLYEKVNWLDNINVNSILYIYTYKILHLEKKYIYIYINKINYILNKKMFLKHSS